MKENETKLLQRVAILERKIEREKKARRIAETQLEEYSREIYQINQSLQRSLLSGQKKQTELTFLAEVSQKVTLETTSHTLLSDTAALIGSFLDADCGIIVDLKGQEHPSINARFVWQNDSDNRPDKLIEEVVSLLPDSEVFRAENWFIAEWESRQFDHLCWIIYSNFSLGEHSEVWIFFISPNEVLDEESLYVLDTARGHLQSGINRRLNQSKILKRNIELNETIKSLEVAKRQLVQSEKMASLGLLAAGVAHEINNPIGFIRSNLENLMDYVSDIKSIIFSVRNEVRDQGVVTMDDLRRIVGKVDLDYLIEDSDEILHSNLYGLDRVRDIVDSLNAFSHKDDGKFKPVNLKDCVEGALKISNNKLKYKHNVELQVPEYMPKVMGNSGQLQQVFVNLFVNAAQAMPEKGTLAISCEWDEKSIKIDVSDTGVGMTEETLKKLFTPFFTTKDVGVGTGLGLSVSYAILEAHQAYVSVYSEVGSGTRFHLTFPVSN